MLGQARQPSWACGTTPLTFRSRGRVYGEGAQVPVLRVGLRSSAHPCRQGWRNDERGRDVQRMGWSSALLDQVYAAVDEAVNLFQRASSAAEGRNGHLSLHHHSCRNIPSRRLAALTVVHNFGVANSDGETPAKRFFGAAHPSLFVSLLEKLPSCRRPGSSPHFRPIVL